MKIYLTPDQIDKIAYEIANSRSVHAIKLLREFLSCSLFIAKTVIDEYPCPCDPFSVHGMKPLTRTEEQCKIARQSAERFREETPQRGFLDFGNMKETLNKLIAVYGTKNILKHVVERMKEPS